MNIIIPIAEFGIYFSFSLLVGHVILLFVPNSKKPKIFLSKPTFLLCTLAIILFSFLPVLQLILIFKESVGLGTAISQVLVDFKIGQAWIFNCIFSIFLWMTIYLESSKYLQALWILLMVLTVGYGSHVATISISVGLFSHTTHYLMAAIWVGVLLQVAWFSKNRDNWLQFLGWFTPLAIICLINIFASGFVIMSSLENPKEYINGWATPYGRMLLIKHISIIPVMAFALINGILAKKASLLDSFDPRIWLKAESGILLIVFYCTGVMGTLPPPNQVVFSGETNVSPTWIEWLLAKNILVPLEIQFTPTLLSILIIVISLLFLGLLILSFKMMSPAFAIMFGGCFILVMYLGLMFSVSLHSKFEINEVSLIPKEIMSKEKLNNLP